MKNIFHIQLTGQLLQLYLAESHYLRRHNWSTHRHCHAEYELHILLDGSSRVEVEEQQIELCKGQGILYVPGEYHRPIETSGSFCRFSLSFSPKTEVLAQALQQALPTSRRFQADDRLLQVCTDIFQEFAAGNSYKQEQLQSLLTVLMIKLLRQMSVEQPQGDVTEVLTEHQRIYRIDSFFEKNFSRNDGEATLAQDLHLSRRQLERVLIKNYGMNYRQKLICTRMDQAAWLLRTKPLHVSQIAQQVGYNSDSAFYNAFRQHFGMTPTKYRKEHARGDSPSSKNNEQ